MTLDHSREQEIGSGCAICSIVPVDVR